MSWACAAAALTIGASCYLENPPLATESRAVDAGAADADADAGPPLCEKYGGYATVEAVVADLIAAIVADCRISRFFTVLPPDRVTHVQDCLVKQVAVVMRCPGIRYDVDNAGVSCRDMRTSHAGLSIRQADLEALVEDLALVLARKGVAREDIDRLGGSLLALREDIVTNSAPGSGRSICGGDAGR